MAILEQISKNSDAHTTRTEAPEKILSFDLKLLLLSAAAAAAPQLLLLLRVANWPVFWPVF